MHIHLYMVFLQCMCMIFEQCMYMVYLPLQFKICSIIFAVIQIKNYYIPEKFVIMLLMYY